MFRNSQMTRDLMFCKVIIFIFEKFRNVPRGSDICISQAGVDRSSLGAVARSVPRSPGPGRRWKYRRLSVKGAPPPGAPPSTGPG
jgi:hypothetical protein